MQPHTHKPRDVVKLTHVKIYSLKSHRYIHAQREVSLNTANMATDLLVVTGFFFSFLVRKLIW